MGSTKTGIPGRFEKTLIVRLRSFDTDAKASLPFELETVNLCAILSSNNGKTNKYTGIGIERTQ